MKQQYLLSVLLVITVSVICYFLSEYIGYKVVALLLLASVSIIGMFLDIFPVLLAAVLSALIWDYFFIPPRFTFIVTLPEDVLMLLMYFIVASMSAVLTYKIRQIEKEARQKEEKENAIRLYNTLFNSLSHELRTPIATIIGSSDALRDNSTQLSDQHKKELIDEISFASLRLNEQVANLMNMSRLESGSLQLKKDWCDINELVYSAIKKLDERKNRHQINILIPENIPLFKLDFGIMEQVIFNLVNNGLQHTPENSIIVIKAALIDATSKKKLQLLVSDNGEGFPANEIDHVFEKFYRINNSKTGGTGLGLSIVKGFVEAHDGKVELRNLPQGGAEFSVNIPAEYSFPNALKNE